MTAPKFTPGPWWFGVADAPEEGAKPATHAGDGYYGHCAIFGNGETQVVGCYEYDVFAKDDGRREANIHLIAAAPELYEALEKCRQWMPAAADHHSADASVYDAMSSADAALAKARGES